MGDMADYLIENGLDYDYYYNEVDGYEEGVTCRYCKEQYLEWEKTEHGWRLFDNKGNIHDCKKYKKE